MGSMDQSELVDGSPEQDEEIVSMEEYEEDYYNPDETGENVDENEAEDNSLAVEVDAPWSPRQEAYIDIRGGSDPVLGNGYIKLEDDMGVSTADESHWQQLFNLRLAPGIQYMTFVPDAGWTNQLHGVLRAVMVAKSLGRTLILPPITAVSQGSDQSPKSQRWSSFFDLETFMRLTGTRVVDIQDLHDHDHDHTPITSENSKCYITNGVGSLRPLDSTAKAFLTQYRFEMFRNELKVETRDLGELLPVLKDLESEHLLCITDAFNIAVPKGEEWSMYGRYLYFAPAVERFYDKALEQLIEQNLRQRLHRQHRDTKRLLETGRLEGEANGPVLDGHPDPNDPLTNNRIRARHGAYIAIHARRDEDHIDYCQQQFQHALSSCLPTSQELASTLHDLLVADPSLRAMPVIVSTNENRAEELAEFRALGWEILDHQHMRTREQLGVFGPMMIDQLFMAHAQVLIGMKPSVLSRIGLADELC